MDVGKTTMADGVKPDQNKKKHEKDKQSGSQPKVDLRAHLDQLEHDLAELKVRFEQYFAGLVPLAPEKQHAKLKQTIRQLQKAPFKNSALNFRLKSIESRYNTYNTYWQRVLRAKEDGTYSKDVFKAEIREKMIQEEKRSHTAKGASERHMKSLYQSYKDALEKNAGKKLNIDYDAFQKSLVQRVKELRESTGGKKFSFKVVVREGKVSLKAQVKEEVS